MSTRKLLVFALLFGVSGHALADTWSDLWSTHEQQGQKLLQANHPGEAAQLFSDPKRRAYAQLQAGQYAKAADLLAPLEDADSQYNRGNALARTGKLPEALAAYDAALAASPGNKDVIRNRDLVAKALENQQQQQGKDGASGKNGKGRQGQSDSDGQGSSGAGDKQSGDKDSGSRENKSGQPGNQNPSAQQGQAGQQSQSGQQGQNGNQGQANAQNQSKGANLTQSGQQGHAGNPQQGADSAGNASTAASSGQSQNPQQAAGASAANQPGQHDQRGAAALQQGQTSGTGTRQGAANMAESPLIKGGAATDAQNTQPRSEQALALDQWLRSIPDDSGELLRRKFQIEHLMRQQGNEP